MYLVILLYKQKNSGKGLNIRCEVLHLLFLRELDMKNSFSGFASLTDKCPSWRRIISLHRLSPMPVPSDLVVKKGDEYFVLNLGRNAGTIVGDVYDYMFVLFCLQGKLPMRMPLQCLHGVFQQIEKHL